MTISAAGFETLLRMLPVDPDYYLHDLDFVNRRALIVRIDKVVYKNAAFLDQRALSPDTEGAWLPMEDVLRCAASIDFAPAHGPDYLFHIGHCGSTLISRFIAEWPHTQVLREPLPLGALSLLKRKLDGPLSLISQAEWQQTLNGVLTLMTRTYRPDDRTLIKATSVCGNLVDDVLARNRESRVMLVYVGLATHLKTMLGSEVNRENSRAFAPNWLSDFHRLTGKTDVRLYELDDARQIALNWLMSMHNVVAAANNETARTLMVNFDSFLHNMEAGLTHIGRFLGKPVPAGEIRALAIGPAAAAYAKQPQQPYNRHMREQALAVSQRQFAAEIQAGLEWGRHLIAATPALARLAPYAKTH